MALIVTALKRSFTFNNIPLPDPGPEFTVDEVKSLYSAQYPDISTALITGPEIKDDVAEYTFVRNVGTKG